MPVQCPECARFLSNAFVAGLQKGPAPCPKCATALTAEQFADGAQDAGPVPVEEPPSADASVRPPDLPPTEVRDEVPDPLAEWDRPDNVVPLTPRRHGHDPTSTGTAIGLGAAVGALIGVVVDDRRMRGAILGGCVGAAAGAATAQALARQHEVDLIE